MVADKGNTFLVYLKNLLIISVVNLLTRIGAAVALSQLWDVDFKVNKYKNVLPVLSYSESNVVLFKQISTLSLIAPSLVIFSVFVYVSKFKKYDSESERAVYVNSWYIGMFLTLLQYAFALFLDEQIQFVNDWRGILVVIGLVFVSTYIYFFTNKKET